MTASYFAYGSNMSPRQMAERCPGAVALGVARLADYRLAFNRPSPKRWGGHVADVVAAPGAEVWGVLWQVSDAHLEALDRFEGVAAGSYRRLDATVEHEGSAHAAVVYVVCEPGPDGAPSATYCATMGEGVTAFAVPGRNPDGTACV